MTLDKKTEALFKKKVELERLKVESETIQVWKEKIDQPIQTCKDFRSLEANLKKILQAMENRLRIIQGEIRELL